MPEVLRANTDNGLDEMSLTTLVRVVLRLLEVVDERLVVVLFGVCLWHGPAPSKAFVCGLATTI